MLMLMLITSVFLYCFIAGFTIKRPVRRWYAAQGQKEKARISVSIIFQEEGEMMQCYTAICNRLSLLRRAILFACADLSFVQHL